MSTSQRILAFLAYLLLFVGWVIVLLFGRRSRLAVYHMKQSIALILFLIAAGVGWAVLAWLTAWVSALFIVGVAAFSLVIAAMVFAVIVWLFGMINALAGRMTPLPIVGGWVSRLPF